MSVPVNPFDAAGALLLTKMFGPAASAVGQTLARYIEFRTRNVGNILDNARQKLGDGLDREGLIPPRVVGRILEEGSYCDDPLLIEYLGGVLASSRTEAGRDDRGAMWASLITRLSSYEVRTHYVVYESVRRLVSEGSVPVPRMYADLRRLRLYVPIVAYRRAMDFGPDELADEKDGVIGGYAIDGLEREALLDMDTAYGRPAFLREKGGIEDASDDDEWGFAVSPCGRGMELFAWAHGLGLETTGDVIVPPLDAPPLVADSIEIPPEIRLRHM